MRVGEEGERESELLSQMVGLSYAKRRRRLRHQPGEFLFLKVARGEPAEGGKCCHFFRVCVCVCVCVCVICAVCVQPHFVDVFEHMSAPPV